MPSVATTVKLPVKIVNIHSLSYTGTTWLNLVLASHVRAFCLGVPDRIWKMREENWDDACRVHGSECKFWREFYKVYQPNENFYVQLSQFSGKDFIVINNPSEAHVKAELTHPDLLIKHIKMIRDGRAIAYSYAQHHQVDYYTAVSSYVRGHFRQLVMEEERDDVLRLRYEDLLSSPQASIPLIEEFLNLKYNQNPLYFWEFEHHITSGNAGTIALLKMFQGIPMNNFKQKQFYEQQFQRMKEQEGQQFSDERWQQELGQRELFIFDYFCGRANEHFGYQPDTFTTTEYQQFIKEIRQERNLLKNLWSLQLPQWFLLELKQMLSYRLKRILISRRKLLVAGAAAWLASIVLSWVIAYCVFYNFS